MLLGRHETGKNSIATWSTLVRALVLVIIFGCLVLGVLGRIAPPEPLSDGELLAVFPDAVRIEISSEPFFHYRALDVSDAPLGAIVVTDSVPPAIKGYLGEIGLAVGVTVDGTITGATAVRHQETPYYMEMITGSGLLERFDELDLSRPFPDIDTVSGATVSSRSIIRDIQEASTLAAQTLFGIKIPLPVTPVKSPWTSWKTVVLTVLLVLSLLVGFTGEGVRLRYTVMLLNLAGIGFVLNTPLTLSAMSRLLTLDFPGPENTLLILILLYITVSLPFQGRAYCRLVCPFGTLGHLIARLSPWQLSLSPGTLAFLPHLRRMVLGLLLFLGVWVGWSGFTEIEPFFSLFSFKLTSILWAMVIFVLVASVFVRRFWCNAMCPTGTLLLMLGRAARPGSRGTDETV